jgi:hypothetical protein
MNGDDARTTPPWSPSDRLKREQDDYRRGKFSRAPQWPQQVYTRDFVRRLDGTRDVDDDGGGGGYYYDGAYAGDDNDSKYRFGAWDTGPGPRPGPDGPYAERRWRGDRPGTAGGSPSSSPPPPSPSRGRRNDYPDDDDAGRYDGDARVGYGRRGGIIGGGGGIGGGGYGSEDFRRGGGMMPSSSSSSSSSSLSGYVSRNYDGDFRRGGRRTDAPPGGPSDNYFNLFFMAVSNRHDFMQ